MSTATPRRGGTIGPGDVQWMTAGAGIVHEEFHSRRSPDRGGTLEMVQLWVNLPAKDKMAAPGYQTLLRQDIPVVDLPEGAATGKKQLIIAGTITSVCMAFPCIAAVHDGYPVFAVVDASGTYSKMAQEITLARLVQAGVVPMDTAAVCSEIQRSWNWRPRRAVGRSICRDISALPVVDRESHQGAGGRHAIARTSATQRQEPRCR